MSGAELPEGWATASVLDVSTLIRGVSYSKGEAVPESRDGFIPLLRATNIDDELRFAELQYVPSGRVSQDQELRPGDVVVAMSSGSKSVVGKAAQLCFDWNGTFGAFCSALRPSCLVDAGYFGLFFHTKYYRDAISEASAGTNINNLKRENFADLRFPVPPLPEQKRIAARVGELLASVNATRARFGHVLAMLKHLRRSVLSQAVRSPEQPPWPTSPLGDLVESIRAGNSFQCEERPPKRNEVGVVKVSAVSWGTYDEEESKTCIDSERVNPDLFIKPDDFLFSRANTIDLVGTCVIAGEVRKRVMLSDKILRLRFRGVDPRWVLLCLRSPEGRAQIEMLSTGNQQSMRNIGQGRIREIEIPLPPLAQQRVIVHRTTALFNLADAIEHRVCRAAIRTGKLTQAILSKAFTGALSST